MTFVGWIVCNDDEEFLALYRGNEDMALMGWASSPEDAQIFTTEEDARRIVRDMGRPDRFVAQFYETADQWLVKPC